MGGGRSQEAAAALQARPQLLTGDQLAEKLKSIIPIGAKNASKLAQNDLARFFVRHITLHITVSVECLHEPPPVVC